mgnify:CR=1 FL=1
MTGPVIRPAQYDDLFAVVALARDFHAASGVPFAFDPARFSAIASGYITAPACLCLVLEVEGAPKGVLMASASMLPFAPVLAATELIFWVDPAHRGRAPRRMIAAYEDWARDQGCAMIGLSSLNDPRVARFYGAAGFAPCDNNFLKMVD